MRRTFPNTVPASLARDGWWLTAAISEPTRSTHWPARTRPPIVIPAALSVFAIDWLAFGYRPGPGLILAVALILSLCVIHIPCTTRRRNIASALFVASALPLIETTGTLPTAFLLLGTLAALTIVKTKPDSLKHIITFAIGHLTHGPFTFLRTACVSQSGFSGRVAFGPVLLTWIPPMFIGGIFLMLFAAANPLIAQTFSQFLTSDGWSLLSPARLFGWYLTAIYIGSALQYRGPRAHPSASVQPLSPPRWLADQPLTVSLVGFNLIFAMQTVLDLTYLWGGVSLPPDLTFAHYAHRGAYPLLATTILAGFLMLTATAFGPPNRKLRILLGIWVAQNLSLMLSAILRLDLYVSAYSLTHLRLAAFVWMGLVATGLILMGWRLWAEHSNGWLIKRLAVVTVATLYACCFINGTHLIATYNVAHSFEATGKGAYLDRYYLCRLGDHAIPAAAQYRALPAAKSLPCLGGANTKGTDWRYADASELRNWHIWGFRDARLARYLATSEMSEAADAQDSHR